MKLEKTKDMQQNAIIQFLENERKGDEYLDKAITKCPEKEFSSCFNYIKEKAKALAVNGCAMIEDKTVYEWAKEYFIDYDARAEKQKKLEEENKAKVIKGRIADTLSSVVNQKATLENNYPELLEKHKIDLIAWENELKANLVNTNERVDEINKGLAVIIDELDALRPKAETPKVEKKEKPKKVEKPIEEEVRNLFNF